MIMELSLLRATNSTKKCNKVIIIQLKLSTELRNNNKNQYLVQDKWI